MIGSIRKNHQTITAISAILVSVIALFVAWDQARVMRAQQHADVWPALQIQSEFLTQADSYQMSLTVKNDGIGPAVVHYVSADMGGEALTNWEELGDRRADGLLRPGMWTGALRGEIVAPGEEVVLARLTWPREGVDPGLLRDHRHLIWSMTMDVCYCSVYGRCWTTDRDTTQIQPQAIAACPVADPESNL